MKRYLAIACILSLMLLLAGCGANEASGKASSGKPATFATDLGGGYGIAFDAKGYLYATGSDNGKPVVWKIDKKGEKEVFSPLDVTDPILSMFDGSDSFAANMAVDGSGNVWMTSSVNGQCYVAAADEEARIVYLNEQISVLFDVKDDAKGIAWDEDSGKLYIITSGPESSTTYSNELILHLTTLTPSDENYAKEIETNENGWDPPPLYVNNDGKVVKQSGVALVDSNKSLYLIGDSQVYTLSKSGKTKAFGKEFADLQLFGGTADDKGNIYVSANTAGDADNGKGAVYKLDAKGKSSLVAKNIGKPLGLAYNRGYLYVMDGEGDRILKISVK